MDLDINIYDGTLVYEEDPIITDGSYSIEIVDILGHEDALSDYGVFPLALDERVKALLSELLGREPSDEEVDNAISDFNKTGLIGGFDIGEDFLSITDYENGNMTKMSSGDTAFQTGPKDAPTATINKDGSAVFTNVNITGRVITIDNTQDIQDAIDELGTDGGTVHLKSGTYTVGSDITLGSSTRLEGDSYANTIIDFDGGAYSVKALGTNVNSTGTIVASGTNPVYDGAYGAYKVTGTSTQWVTDGIDITYQIFLNTRWYKIASVISETVLLLAEGYGDDLDETLTVRIAKPVQDLKISNITIQNSSTHGISFLDSRFFEMTDVVTQLNGGNGINIENIMGLTTNRLSCLVNTGDGFNCKNSGFGAWNSIPSIANGGNGMTLENIETVPITSSSASSNTGNGVEMKDCVDLYTIMEVVNNGDNGVELTEYNSNIVINASLVSGNTNDGIKILKGSSRTKILGSKLTNNGGYGINIPVNLDGITSTATVITTNDFLGNSSGPLADDWSLDTVVKGNSGLPDRQIDLFSVNGNLTLSAGDIAMLLDDGKIAVAGGYEGTGIDSCSTPARIIGIVHGMMGFYVRVITGGDYMTTGLTPGSSYGPSRAYASYDQYSRNTTSDSTVDMNSAIIQTFTTTRPYLDTIYPYIAATSAATYSWTEKLYKGTPGSGVLLDTLSHSYAFPNTDPVYLGASYLTSSDYPLLTPGEDYYVEFTNTNPGEINVYYQSTGDPYAGGDLYIGGAIQSGADMRFLTRERLGESVLSTTFNDDGTLQTNRMGIALDSTTLRLRSLPL